MIYDVIKVFLGYVLAFRKHERFVHVLHERPELFIGVLPKKILAFILFLVRNEPIAVFPNELDIANRIGANKDSPIVKCLCSNKRYVLLKIVKQPVIVGHGNRKGQGATDTK